MWNRFMKWMETDKAGAITNGLAALIWVWIAASARGEGETLMRWLGGINTLLFAFVAGGKLSDHFRKPILNMWKAAAETQHQTILGLIEENGNLRRAMADAGDDDDLEWQDDSTLS